MDPEIDYVGLLRALIQTESSNNPSAVSEDNATGLTQILPRFAHDMGGNVPSVYEVADIYGVEYGAPSTDEAKRLLMVPEISIHMGDKVLQRMMQRERGEVDDALRAYNMGADALDGWEQSGKRISSLDDEAREYPGKIRSAYEQLTGMTLPTQIAPVRENGIGYAPGASIRPQQRPQGLLSNIGMQ